MRRGQLMVKMVAQAKEIQEKEDGKENVRKRKKKDENSSNTFNYLKMYDEGRWEEFDRVLQGRQTCKSVENLPDRQSKRKRLDFDEVNNHVKIQNSSFLEHHHSSSDLGQDLPVADDDRIPPEQPSLTDHHHSTTNSGKELAEIDNDQLTYSEDLTRNYTNSTPPITFNLATSFPKQTKCPKFINCSPSNHSKSCDNEFNPIDHFTVVFDSSSYSNTNIAPLKDDDRIPPEQPSLTDHHHSTTNSGKELAEIDNDQVSYSEDLTRNHTNSTPSITFNLATSTPKQTKCPKFINCSPSNHSKSCDNEFNPIDHLTVVFDSSSYSNTNIAPLKKTQGNVSTDEFVPMKFFDDYDSDDDVGTPAHSSMIPQTPAPMLERSEDVQIDDSPSNTLETIPKEDEVIGSSKEIKKKRRYDRRNYCMFCDKLVLQIRRHFLNNHKNEIEIAQYISLFELNAKDTQERRKQILADLTAKGNHIHNKSVLSNLTSVTDSSLLLPAKRPPINKKKASNDYVFCTLCQGLFVKNCFRLHATACKGKDKNANGTNIDHSETEEGEPAEEESPLNEHDQKQLCMRRNNYVKEYGIATHLNPKETSKQLQENIIPILRKDDIGITGMKDPLIMSIASDFYSSHKSDKDKTQVTRKIRDGAKLLMKVKEKHPKINSLQELFQTNHLEIVLEACQSLCNLEDGQNNKVIVGMNARLSWILEEGSKRLIDDIVCRNDISDMEKGLKKNNVKDFQECLRRRWKYYVSTNSETSRRRLKISKDFLLPLDEDIKTFAEMLRNMELEYESKLKHEVTIYHYEMMCKIIICHILTLNRRRPFEATNAEIEFYLKRKKSDDYYSEELLNTFATEEQLALNQLSSFEVPAKGTESVATILLTKQMEKCIDLIISCRPAFKLEENKYLFARPGLTTPFDGSKVLREMKGLCPSLKKPEHFTATGLRHHVATLAHTKGPNFSSKISNFMTHTMAVHEKNYVAPVSMVHKGIIGNYMAILEGTSLGNEGMEYSGNAVSLINDEENSTRIIPQTVSNLNNHDETTDPTFEPNGEESDLDESISYNNRRTRNPTKVQKWTDKQKETLITHFKDFIQNKKNPGTLLCRQFLSQFGSLFPGKTPNTLNVYIDNINRKKLKIPAQLTHLFE